MTLLSRALTFTTLAWFAGMGFVFGCAVGALLTFAAMLP